MAQLITAGLGLVIVLVGILILGTSRETADDMTQAAENTPAPDGIFTAGSLGCAGIAVIAVGVVMLTLALVVH